MACERYRTGEAPNPARQRCQFHIFTLSARILPSAQRASSRVPQLLFGYYAPDRPPGRMHGHHFKITRQISGGRGPRDHFTL